MRHNDAGGWWVGGGGGGGRGGVIANDALKKVIEFQSL